jgi:hypothetical protein
MYDYFYLLLLWLFIIIIIIRIIIIRQFPACSSINYFTLACVSLFNVGMGFYF